MMSTNIVFKKVEHNEELVIEEIATEIINDLILEFCFEMHRAIKLGYIESYFASENNQESRSLESSFLESKFCFNKADKDKEHEFSNQQGTVDTKKINGLATMAKGDISMKEMDIVNSYPINSNENRERLDFYEQSERTKKIKIKLPVMKPTLSETLNKNPLWYVKESRISFGVMNGSVFKENGPITDLGILKSSDEHLKLSTAQVDQVPSIVHRSDLTKISECHSYYTPLELEKEWIKEAFHCSECKNSKSLQDWMQFIALTETGVNETRVERNVKEFLVDEEVKCSNRIIPDKKEQIHVDMFGNHEKSTQKNIYKRTCTCPICKRNVGAVRFSYHLSTCMGLTRRRSTRIYSD